MIFHDRTTLLLITSLPTFVGANIPPPDCLPVPKQYERNQRAARLTGDYPAASVIYKVKFAKEESRGRGYPSTIIILRDGSNQ